MATSPDILTQIDELKARLASSRPLPEAALNKIEEALAIEYTYESNRIEGNTLTLQETALVIEEGLTIGGKACANTWKPSITTRPSPSSRTLPKAKSQ